MRDVAPQNKIQCSPIGSGLTARYDFHHRTGPDATNVCLYELSRIHGSCRDTSTQLALEFSVVVDQQIGDDAATFTRKFKITPPAQLKLLSEILALSGGLGGGDWKWSAPSMQLGATVVQAHHSHGSRPARVNRSRGCCEVTNHP
jgi:hypothetical protein